MKTYICTNCTYRSCVVATEGSPKPHSCPYDCHHKSNWHQAGKSNDKDKSEE